MTATIVPGPGVRRGQGPESLIPHNIEAEQGLLGALLLNNDLHDHIAGSMPPISTIRCTPTSTRRRPTS